MPIFVPPSPTVSSLALFTDYPVSLHTGIPDISIPIYELMVDDFKMPITLKYHSSGVRVAQEASWVGLGWALNVGGTISRTVKGIDDFAKNGTGGSGLIHTGFYYAPSIYNQSLFFPNIPRKLVIDSEPDLFYFNLPHISGKFLLDQSNGPVLFDKSTDVKISVNEQIPSLDNYFTITTPDGTQYIFDRQETAEVASIDERLQNGEYSGYGDLFPQDNSKHTNHVSAWLLTKIVLANKNEINFTYTNEQYQSPAQESCANYVKLLGNPACGVPTSGIKYSSYKQTISGFRLTKISWNNGHIDFIASGRSDMKTGGFNDGTHKLDSIRIYNKTGELVKQYAFDYSYFDNSQNPGGTKNYLYKRLKLSGLEESGVGTYSFDYNAGNLPAKNNTNSDYWGFYNGQNYGDNYYTQVYRGTMLYQGALKESNYACMLIGSLKKINYPTGGYVKFSYEMNTFGYSGLKYVLGTQRASNITEGAGLRIAQIETGGNNTTTKIRKFNYSGGLVIKPLWLAYTQEYEANCMYCSGFVTYLIQTSAAAMPFTSFAKGNIVGYDMAEEIITEGNKTAFTRHYFYNFVEDEEDDGDANIPYVSTSINYYNGLPTVIKYGYRESNTQEYFTKVISYEYENVWQKTVNAFHVKLDEFIQTHVILGAPVCFWVDGLPNYYAYRFEWVRKLSETITTAKETNGVLNYFTESSGIVETTQYQDYDALNAQPKTIIKDLYTRKVFYPQDFSDTLSQGMVNRYMIETPVEIITMKGNQVVSGKKIKYKYESLSGLYVPDIEYKLTTPLNTTLTLSNYRNYFEPELYYNKYNLKGKALQIQMDDLTTTYLWGYNHQYPIAEIKNATYQQVKDALSETVINRIASAATPAPSDLTLLNNLRSNSNLQKAEITTYEYKPLVGMTKQTSPQGIVTTYEYDAFGRLQTVKDPNGNQLEGYDYHYKNP
jgi:YD repeat-containing protein